MSYTVIETVHSIMTPDAGHCSTVYVSADKLEFPYYDKSVAMHEEFIPFGIKLSYRTGEKIMVPFANIRFCTEAKEIETKKEPHKVNPVFGIVKPKK